MKIVKIVKKKRKKPQKPLKWSMIVMLLSGWLLPLLLISFCLLYFVSSMINRQIEKTILLSADKAVEICDMQMEEIAIHSRNASYNTAIRDSYERYRKDGKDIRLYSEVTKFLNQQYKYNRTFLYTMVFFMENPVNMFCYTFNTYSDNNIITAGYSHVEHFQKEELADILLIGETLDTKIELVQLNGKLYLVRNLMNSYFEPFAMIVMELDPEGVFGSLNSVWGAVRYELFIDGAPLMGTELPEAVNSLDLTAVTEDSVYVHEHGIAYVYKVVKYESKKYAYVVELDSQVIIDDLSMLRYILVLVLIFLVPLIILVFWFFYHKVTRPVNVLVEASREIEEGNYGYTIEGTGDSQEFFYLNRAFNAMSAELKHQFEKIYLEELALRDANIKALQSQINPHFLNNTLEIINWEARMNGNESVSGMIEALGTMLEATMNRKQARLIPLSEELAYVDAYLYIIKKRLGDRLLIEKQVDEALLKVEVPRLIIQPIVENAVEHGERGRHQKIALRVYRIPENPDIISIQVFNNGTLTKEDKERIEYLLSGDDIADKNERHVSLGIRNVDRRLRIIYGEECRLTIENDGNNQTVSTILVKINDESKNRQ